MQENFRKKYHIYNSLFLNLDYQNSNSIGHLIPILGEIAKLKLSDGINPMEIFNEFHTDYQEIIGSDKIDFMFKVIQYVERQVVLFDSIEDSISPYELEDHHTVQLDDLFAKTKDDQERNSILEVLNKFKVRIVLTAHPTQFYRPPVLDIIAKLREQIFNNKIEEIDRLLHQLGLTSLVNKETPTPFDEALNIIHICRYEYYDAIGRFYYNLKTRCPGFENFDLIRLGFWPCGDRDGNPFVTFQATKQVIDALRMTLMKCYYKDLKYLGSKLTFNEIEPIISNCKRKVYQAMFNSNFIVGHEEIIFSLEKIRDQLINNYEGLYLDLLDRMICKVNIYKSHFASLDIRQDHTVHLKCVEQILIQAGKIEKSIDELEKEELKQLLTEDFIKIPENLDLKDQFIDTISNIGSTLR